jgi:NTF2 fold immunity protein
MAEDSNSECSFTIKEMRGDDPRLRQFLEIPEEAKQSSFHATNGVTTARPRELRRWVLALMKIRPAITIVAVVLAVSCVRHSSISPSERSNGLSQNNLSANSLKPKRGYVPDETTAIAIAKAVWTPVFGQDQIEAQKPITAKLQDGVWVVQGHNPVPYPECTFVAEISQDDGRILEVFFYND